MEDARTLKLGLCVNWVVPEQTEEALILGRDRLQNKYQIAPFSMEGVLFGSKHLPFRSIQASFLKRGILVEGLCGWACSECVNVVTFRFFFFSPQEKMSTG